MTNVRERRGAALREIPETPEQKAQLQYELEQEMRLMEEFSVGDDEVPDLTVVDATPGRRYNVWFSMVDGSEIRLPKFMKGMVLAARLPNGRPMYTAYRDDTPKVQPGQWKCFLHPEAPEREIVELLGIAVTCPYAHGPSQWAKRGHENAMHQAEHEAFQDHVFRQKDEEHKQQRSNEIEAMTASAAAMQSLAASAEASARAVAEGTKATSSEPKATSTGSGQAASRGAKAEPAAPADAQGE